VEYHLAIAVAEIGCPECDLLIARPTLAPGQRAMCPRCGFVLTVCHADPANRALSFAISALVFLAIAISYPFLTINNAGVEVSMTLLQTVWHLADYGSNIVAILVFALIILIPATMLVTTILVVMMLQNGLFPDWMLPVTRWLFHFDAWAMVEVFSIAVIVSLVKIISMARVEIGWSFWAYLTFNALFILAFSSLDRLTVWSTVSRLRHQT
jgi:paraquat-inducible protein A